jgi:hypothetical protein
MAALSVRKPEAPRPAETDKCGRACDAYDTAHAAYLESAGAVSSASGDRNASGAAALAGLAILTFAGTNFVWGAALMVVLACGALAVRQQLALNAARDACQTAIQNMYMEYRQAKKACAGADCAPRPDQACR